MMRLSPTDPDKYIGTITVVTASQVQANLPNATAKPERRALARGAVGDFVFVDCERTKLLGRITEVKIPDSERLTVEPRMGEASIPNPIGRIQLLATVAEDTSKLNRGVNQYPKIGDGVYLAGAEILAMLIGGLQSSDNDGELTIGEIEAGNQSVPIKLSPEKLFGRHCGIFGATGGGKSWTLASLIEKVKARHGKALIFDPTGEFCSVDSVDTVFSFQAGVHGARHTHFPYTEMTEDDLFSLFRPSGQSQSPKLRDAIKSLKLLRAFGDQIPQGVSVFQGRNIEKNGRDRASYFNALAAHAQAIHDPKCNFNISALSDQLKMECVHPNGFQPNPHLFGGTDQNASSYCDALASRINTLVNSAELACLFQNQGDPLVTEIENFLADPMRDIALISFKEVRFEHSTRELLLNIIGRYLLSLARSGRFVESPLIVMLDEAHQFLGRKLGDDYGGVNLDAFGLIAKEGRKYGLTCVLATQRPRDVPQDVLSQLGTMIVHRLTNEQDRNTIESACGDLDKAATQFIPMLAAGEAIVVGPDLPTPLPLRMIKPLSPPDSKGPQFQSYWDARREQALAYMLG